MQPSPKFPPDAFEAPASSIQRPVKAATIVYQGLTIAAMALLLGSLWVF